jgi:hypothetical protein
MDHQFVKLVLKKMAPLVVLSMALMLSGCASLVSDNTYDVSIVSVQKDVSFSITDSDGKLVAEGVTPEVVSLDSFAGYFKKAIYDVTYSHTDFPDKAVQLKATFSPFYFVNYPFGGAIGFLIDPFTGAMFNLPKELSGDLTTDVADKKDPWN